jgi:3-vinyl bacteriochlorophyllide hydratase
MDPSPARLSRDADRPDQAHWLTSGFSISNAVDQLIERIAPCPWVGHTGGQPFDPRMWPDARPRPLYTADERRRRDATPWTLVQGILAPLQFLAFGVSVILIARYLTTGHGLALAEASILVKTALLYTIMITGSVWEKVVFGRWLFAPSFFWEDLVSMLVLTLQTAYVAALLAGWGAPRDQLMIAVAAYGAYAVNATQFLLKLRAARLQGAPAAAMAGLGHAG